MTYDDARVRQLIPAVLDGQNSAFRAILAEIRKPMRQWLFKRARAWDVIDELDSAVDLGIWKACRAYDGTKGMAFRTYALWHCINTLKDEAGMARMPAVAGSSARGWFDLSAKGAPRALINPYQEPETGQEYATAFERMSDVWVAANERGARRFPAPDEALHFADTYRLALWAGESTHVLTRSRTNDAIQLAWFEGRTVTEAAKEVGIARAGVDIAILRAQKRFASVIGFQLKKSARAAKRAESTK